MPSAKPAARTLSILTAAGLTVSAFIGSAVAQTVATDAGIGANENPSKPELMGEPLPRGQADPESILITLSGHAREIRQQLMDAGETGPAALEATMTARDIAEQGVDAASLLAPANDPQVTTTRRSDVETARAAFSKLQEVLGVRVLALEAGDMGAANEARLSALDAINDMPDSIRFE